MTNFTATEIFGSHLFNQLAGIVESLTNDRITLTFSDYRSLAHTSLMIPELGNILKRRLQREGIHPAELGDIEGFEYDLEGNYRVPDHLHRQMFLSRPKCYTQLPTFNYLEGILK